MSVHHLGECGRCQYTIPLSVPLEKHTSHLLAISIYLAACVWLIWKTQSTCLFPLRNQPLPCNLQALCSPEHTAMETTAKCQGAGLGPRRCSVWLLCYQLCKGKWHPLQPPVSSLVTSQPESQLTLLLLSQSGWVRTPKPVCLGRSDSR